MIVVLCYIMKNKFEFDTRLSVAIFLDNKYLRLLTGY